MASFLTVTGLIQLFACLAFAYTAREVAARSMRQQDASAVRAFRAWWGGMSLYMGVTGTLAIAASLGWHPLDVFTAARLMLIPVIALAAGGLAYYVAYLYTGRRSLRYLIAAYYTVIGAVYMTAAYLGGATQVVVTDWSAALAPRIAALDVIYALFGVPVIIAAFAYLSLAFRPLGRTQRYRIALVSSSILAWVVSGMVTSALQDPFLIFIGITFLGLVTSFAVLLAYRPPSFIRRYLEEPEKAAETVHGASMMRRAGSG